MLAVSDDFIAAEQADVNNTTAKAYLILGDYARPGAGASASATSSDGSGDYPASGAINGDHTELNVGPASGADNDVGKASWKSSVKPSSANQSLTIDLGQTRTINRMKLYNRASNPINSYLIYSSTDGVTYTLFTRTIDGGGPITPTHEVDVVDFLQDLTCRYFRLTITGMSDTAQYAEVVALELYRLVDISDRLISVKTQNARDYQLTNSLAASVQLVCSNSDQFFSPSYVPTTAQVAAGFVNSELAPNIGIIVKMGFDYRGSDETPQQFIGKLDKLTIKPGMRTATLEGRDGMKGLFDRIVSTKLKTSQDIKALIEYLLNKANISTFETDVETTGITVDYFFTFDEALITSIRSLVEAAGDANFYFSEDGTATFRMYLNSVPQQDVFSSETEWETGSFTNMQSTSLPGTIRRKWFCIDTFTDGNYTSNPAWSFGAVGSHTGTWVASSGYLQYTSDTLYSIGAATTPMDQAYGTWEAKVALAASGVGRLQYFFMAAGVWADFGPRGMPYLGYYVELTRPGANWKLELFRSTGPVAGTSLASLSFGGGGADSSFHNLRVTRDSAGAMNVYWDGSLKLTATDANYSVAGVTGFVCYPDSTHAPSTGCIFQMDDIFFNYELDATTTISADQAVWTSPTIDQGAAILSEGIFRTTYIPATGCTVNFYTRTSEDGSVWQPWVEQFDGAAISSVVKRYLQVKAVITTPQDGGTRGSLVTPYIQDLTINWFTGAGSEKFPTTVTHTFDESLNMDLEQAYADNIGGESSIINSVAVKAQPLILSGANADVQWQGTTATPPAAISASNPLGITLGQVLTYKIVVSGGMDTSRMTGANPAAAVFTFAGGGAATWRFSSIHPTRPVLEITVTGTGTITALTVQGKTFSSDDTILEQSASDQDSIDLYDERLQQITNAYIVNTPIALQIAQRLVLNFANPTTYIPQVKVRPAFSVQIGDRVRISDAHLNIEDDSIVTGIEHYLAAAMNGGDQYTSLTLLKIQD